MASKGLPGPPKATSKGTISSAPAQLKKATDIAARLQSDLELRDIEESTDLSKFREEENDVLVAAEVDDSAEEMLMQSMHGVVEMSAAERELETWTNTHVLTPYRIENILRRVGGRFAPRVECGNDEAKLVEYLGRSYQEFLYSILPDLVSLSNHSGSGSSVVSFSDLEAYRSVSRLLSSKIDVLLD